MACNCKHTRSVTSAIKVLLSNEVQNRSFVYYHAIPIGNALDGLFFWQPALIRNIIPPPRIITLLSVPEHAHCLLHNLVPGRLYNFHVPVARLQVAEKSSSSS